MVGPGEVNGLPGGGGGVGAPSRFMGSDVGEPERLGRGGRGHNGSASVRVGSSGYGH